MSNVANLPRPEPAAGLDAYHAERQACLSRSSVKRDNYRKAVLGARSAEVDYLPIKADVENVSRCNFACEMCAVSKWKKGKRAEDMSLECFKRFIDEQYGLVEIKLNGLGEALMQGDDYFEMIKYARERRIWVRMTTNASLLHLRDNYRKLIDSGVNEIDISIDGADAPTFEGIRIQGDFSRVKDNCKLLNDYAKSVGKPSAKMWTLVQKGNRHNLAAHVSLARALGFDHLVFSTELHGWGSDELAQRNRDHSVTLDEAELRLLLLSGEGQSVRVAFWDVATKFTPQNLCPWPFERVLVTSDSRNVPCCMIGDPDAFELGKGDSSVVAWFGSDYKKFREGHLTGNVPSVCRGCYK